VLMVLDDASAQQASNRANRMSTNDVNHRLDCVALRPYKCARTSGAVTLEVWFCS
jgi:hypothetical protein